MSDDWRMRMTSAFPDLDYLTKGNASAFDFAVDVIRLGAGEPLKVQQAGVTAFVGANNSGKSTLLREVSEKLAHQPGYPEAPRLVVESLDLVCKGEPADVVAWLGENASFVVEGPSAGFRRPQTSVEPPQLLLQAWGAPYSELGRLSTSLVFYGNAQGRFSIGGSAEMRDSIASAPQHPVHYLQDSKELLDKVSAITRDIFRAPLTLDTLGRTLRLRVGEIDMEHPRINDIPPEYRSKMASLRPLDEQGDGMRSLLGQLLPVVTSAYKLIILDEPEAFLHPPQAHALGVELGRLAVGGGLQILLATHDRSLLTGLLDSGVDVSIVRLTRSDGPPTASRLDSDQLKELWNDPVLKYTNVLDGLFHRLVVVTEAEGDCAYLAAALDCPGGLKGAFPRNEILFVPTGGKAGMAKVCAALTAVNVPVVAAPDLDMLSSQTDLSVLVGSVGGTWTEQMGKDWKAATSDITAAKEPATVGHVLDAIVGALDAKRDDSFTSEDRKTILAHSRATSSGWASVKKHGLSAFKGEARTAVDRLLSDLSEAGVVLVQEGELECLAPEVPVRKGPAWLPAALTAGAQCNVATQSHVDRIMHSGANRLASQGQ